jgi:hypothetical protein
MPLAPNINTPIAPHVDIDVDISLLEHELARFAEATDRDLAAVLRQQAGLLGEDMMRATPPVGKFTGAKESWSAQRKIGRAAVGRDIDRMAGSFNELEMMSGTGRLATRMRKLVRRGDTNAIASILRASKVHPSASSWHILPADIESVHKLVRNTRGRVPQSADRNKRWLKARDKARLKRQAQARVFNLKAGWAGPVRRLGRNVPAMISRVLGTTTQGRLVDRADAPRDPHVDLINVVSYARQQIRQSLVSTVIRNRRGKVERQMAVAIDRQARRASRRLT